MATVIVDEDYVKLSKLKRRKIILSVIFIVLIAITIFFLWPKQTKVEKVSFGTITSSVATDTSNGGNPGNRTDAGIDGAWGVANNTVDRLKADPELVKDPLKFKKAVESMNSENEKLVAANLITFNELKSHNLKSDCRTTLDGFVYNISGIFATGYDADGKLDKVCGRDSGNEIKGLGMENAIRDFKIGKLE